jgi:nucleoporin POM152
LIRRENTSSSRCDQVLYAAASLTPFKVKDANCPGDVLDEADYEIDFKPRPSVRLGSPDDQGKGLMKKTEFCAGEEDQVALVFSGAHPLNLSFRFAYGVGQAPFELGYSYGADGRVSRHTLKSAQDTGILHLAAEPGTHRYDFMDLKDSNYANIPVHIVVDHHVHSRPSVSFSKTNSRPICLDSHLSGDAKVKLEGRAPFKLEVSVRRPASSKVETFSVDVKGHEWVLDVPFIVKDVGRHEVTISSVKDASGCAWDIREADILSTTVEVVESARIVPVSSAKDLCVGDTLDFLLQGKAPWTVE